MTESSSIGWRFGTVALLAGCWALGCDGNEPAPADPHVILISVDTLRSDHVGLYGYERDTTPQLDRFFALGTVFENASSSAPCTVPSVRQLLSGGFDVNPRRRSLPERLRDRGYVTGAVMSQHMFHYQTERDYSAGFSHFDLQGPDEADAHGFSTRTADQVSDLALAWLEQQDGQSPIFLWLHYFDPHDPYQPPNEFRRFDPSNPSTRSGDRRSDLMRERRSSEEPWAKAGYIYDQHDVEHLVDLYDGEIAFTDAQIGRVLNALGERDWIDNSIFVLTSDHGEWLGENGWWDHCLSVREQEIRVPLAIRVRGGRLSGRDRVLAATSTLDVVPTLLAELGIASDDGSHHGTDLHSVSDDRVQLSMWDDSVAARDRSWKLFVNDRWEPIGLFRVDHGQTEEHNLLHAHPEVVRRLEASVRSMAPILEEVSRQWDETTELLRSIGYVE